ncbi:MAG: ABC transporter permease [Chloroflexi bacterium]|nr:ABC transporter permease [Chloroflexota bacterium]MCL5951901.1 ABC transporter permease [Chloroflexota bacterium]
MRFLFSAFNYNLADPSSIPNLFVQHLRIVGIAMLISILIAIPVGLLASRYRRLYLPIITMAGLLYSIPGIAFVAVLITVTGLTLGTILIPLIAYNQLALIRNTVAGVNGIDPLFLEVGRAMGMNRVQLLRRVQLPLALPVVVAGIRIATVTTIGIASLAGFIGQGGLGSIIFMNITVRDYDAILGGAILLALLAIVADLLLLVVQTALNRGRSAFTVS